MIDHIGCPVTNIERAKAFYAQALAPLGYVLIMDIKAGQYGDNAAAAGYGVPPKPDFWIGEVDAVGQRIHVAIAAASRAVVDAFHAAALAAGGRDNGAPGLRPEYHPDYYGAFVLDPDGHNIEAVCHVPG